MKSWRILIYNLWWGMSPCYLSWVFTPDQFRYHLQCNVYENASDSLKKASSAFWKRNTLLSVLRLSHQPPVHVQGWLRLNNQILVTSQIVIQTFTKMGKCPKSANNQNSLKSWTPLFVILLDYYHFLLCTKSNYRVSQKRLALGM